ncbi:RHS repeat domain-containing protein, partial [Pseudomonas sp.]|uniref:RHS repeat domain-containing protein n=1 Tax=Pseudomonas sp. TaxID=306 RepID=UPI0026DCE0AD
QDVQERFGHNPAGNLLMQDRPGPDIVAGNRLMIQGDHHYDYDAFGNLIRERRGKGHALVTEYRYDCQHRLIGVTKPNGQTASYRYDPFGRRISKTVDGITTEFFWQGDKLIAEHHADRHRSYLYEPHSFRPLALLEGFGPEEAKPYHYQLDHLGTPQELTTPEGEIAWSAHYRAYGEISRLDVGKIDNPLRFQGQYYDQESGLHYNRHRYYHPDIGRYLTPDPARLAGGINAYQYVPNPTGWVDPLGLSSCPESAECRPAYKAQSPFDSVKVDSGEPQTPEPRLTARQARIEELTEANAKRRILEYEEKYDMHMVGKHGPEVESHKVERRSIDGTDPITGRTPINRKGVPSSQFNSWKFQLQAWTKATSRTERGLPRYTGVDDNRNDIVRLELPGAGRGYRPNRRDPSNPTFNPSMNAVEMKFREDGTPFTLFPIKE